MLAVTDVGEFTSRPGNESSSKLHFGPYRKNEATGTWGLRSLSKRALTVSSGDAILETNLPSLTLVVRSAEQSGHHITLLMTKV